MNLKRFLSFDENRTDTGRTQHQTPSAAISFMKEKIRRFRLEQTSIILSFRDQMQILSPIRRYALN